MGYARADRKHAPRMPVGIRIAFNMLESVRPDRMIIMDIHAEQTLALVQDAIVDHLFGSKVLVPALRSILKVEPFVIASPDVGGSERARKYARFLGQDDLVILSKNRKRAGEIDEAGTRVIGDVSGKVVVFVDDLLDTGGTLIAGAKAVKAQGAMKVIVCVTHGLFSKGALKRITESDIDHVLVTDSIGQQLRSSKVTIVSLADLLGDAVRRTHDGESLSSLILE